MLHLGDICKINGAEIEPVWCITGGSPCQDLSIAGKRAGLAGARSGLFMEQVRIVNEMRAEDKRNGRTGDMVRPRFLVWENVVGAFSSNRGKDFAAVLEEIARIAEPGFSLSGLPDKQKWTKAGAIDGDGWSIAWRTHDAKDWGKTIRDSRTGNVIRLGTPQRRRRISVVADFGGEFAAQIQFDRESVSGHFAESGAAGEGSAGAAESGASYAVRIRGGCDGGGKGALVQTEKSGTLGTGNDQTIFTPTPINLMVATRCKALGRGTGFGVGEPGDPANTISAAHSHGVFATAIPINEIATRWQGGGESRNHDGSGNGLGIGKEGDPSPTLTAGDRHGVMCMNPWDAQSARVYDQDGAWHSLNANENGGMARDSVLCAGFKLGNSEQARSIGYQEELSPTLNAECGGNKPAVVALDMSHACDVIRECGEQVPALQARMGTGGNQVPLTYQMNGFGDYRAAEVASSCKQRDFKDSTDLVCAVDCRNFREGGEVNGTLQAKESGGQSLNLNNTIRQNMVVRRLTPMECERLQGFPDHWTDIGEWTDEKGKKHKNADSPRYKALGNSIALPFWDWMLRRMARYLPEDATLGSLFDGIAGFPLIWERIHGKGTARWASEIEPFPIAVTKKHFPEEE
jgi:DNA (cytosine-5)-methyltransferase 1